MLRKKFGICQDAAEYILELLRLSERYIKCNRRLEELARQPEFLDDIWIEQLYQEFLRYCHWTRPLSLWYRWRLATMSFNSLSEELNQQNALHLNLMDELVMVYSELRRFVRYDRNLIAYGRKVDLRGDELRAQLDKSGCNMPNAHLLNTTRTNLKQGLTELEYGVDNGCCQLQKLAGDIVHVIGGKEPDRELKDAINFPVCNGVLTKAANLRDRLLPIHTIIQGSYTDQMVQIFQGLTTADDNKRVGLFESHALYVSLHATYDVLATEARREIQENDLNAL